jgi:hypothetical protein
MKLAIMQPYFFPYLGYFQLIAASDIFVLHDDVQYIKGGWVNRNRILLNGEDRMITYPVQKDAYELPINARSYVDDKQARKDIINLIKQAYAKAPFYQQVFPVLEELLMFEDRNVARFNENLIRRICDFTGIRSSIITSSGMEKDNGLAGEPRVLDICRRLGATDYTNPQGGQSLYDTSTFRNAGINLRFLVMRAKPYPQRSAGFVPYLSIIDALMELGPDEIKPYLGEYDLITTPVDSEKLQTC